jgi:hypothetical protein
MTGRFDITYATNLVSRLMYNLTKVYLETLL